MSQFGDAPRNAPSKLPARLAAVEGVLLTGPEQLPDLPGETLILTWDQIDTDTVVLHGDRVVWRERTGWEVYDRFQEIACILK